MSNWELKAGQEHKFGEILKGEMSNLELKSGPYHRFNEISEISDSINRYFDAWVDA